MKCQAALLAVPGVDTNTDGVCVCIVSVFSMHMSSPAVSVVTIRRGNLGHVPLSFSRADIWVDRGNLLCK